MKKLTASILLLAVLTSLFSCVSGDEYTLRDYTVFDTETVIIGSLNASKESFDAESEYAVELLSEYHKLYDIYHEYAGINNLKTVNDAAGEHPVEVDEKIIDLLKFGIEMYTLTAGRTNIAMGSVLKIWHEYREDGKAVPTEEELNAAAEHVSIDSIIIDEENGTVFISDKNASIDVGAIAKGFATERVAEALYDRGINTGYALNVGGNVRVIGKKRDGSLWSTGIDDARENTDSSTVCVLKLTDTSAVTSGSYQRFYEVDGIRYHHIIDPETLFPENRYISVSIIFPDSGVADALSTALFNMSEEEGRKILEDISGEAIWVYPDGHVSQTDGIANMK